MTTIVSSGGVRRERGARMGRAIGRKMKRTKGR
jgi:hypothetical protein